MTLDPTQTDMPQEPLLEIVYASETPKPMDEQAVRALLDHAREKNAEMGVTGLLCYDNRQFLQIIEGETHVIMDLFFAIQADPRHTNVRILHEGDIDRRAFSDWKMAYEPMPSGLLPALARSIHAQSLTTDNRDGTLSAGRRIFTLFMDEMYGGEPQTEREPADA